MALLTLPNSTINAVRAEFRQKLQSIGAEHGLHNLAERQSTALRITINIECIYTVGKQSYVRVAGFV